VADDAVEKVKADADARRIRITVDCDAALEFIGDRGELDILVSNLLTNAVKYNRDGGMVDLSLRAEDGGLRLLCRDSGIGMTKDEAEGLFREFYRVKNKNTKDILGSGLGLSIVKKIVDLYRGVITVESVPDKGTEMTVFLKPDSPAGGEAE
jgi:signal transduction histidine kinase